MCVGGRCEHHDVGWGSGCVSVRPCRRGEKALIAAARVLSLSKTELFASTAFDDKTSTTCRHIQYNVRQT